MQDLIHAAKEAIRQRFNYPTHSVGAAIQTASGKVYIGVNIRAQKMDLCAEWIPLGQAIMDGEEIAMGVAVRYFEDGTHEVYAPCAQCRELYLTFAPEAKLVISEEETKQAKELLPHAWVNKKHGGGKKGV